MRSDVLAVTGEQVTRCSRAKAGHCWNVRGCGLSSFRPSALCCDQRGIFCLGHLGDSPPLRSQKMSGEEYKYFLTLFPLLRDEIGEEKRTQQVCRYKNSYPLLGNGEAQLLPISLHEIRRPRGSVKEIGHGMDIRSQVIRVTRVNEELECFPSTKRTL